MQNSQQISWWLEIIKIAIPSFITLAIGLWLSRKTESYKKELSKEIEDYKKDISKELYKYQTKFSVYHQKQAEVIAEIYGLFAELEYVLNQVTHWFQRNPTDEKLKRRLDEKKIREVS